MSQTQRGFQFDGLANAFGLPPEGKPAASTTPTQISREIQTEFNRRANAEADRGAKWIGAKAIAEDMRRYSQLHSGTNWKINNSDVAQLAANAERIHPRLRGKFKHRKPKTE